MKKILLSLITVLLLTAGFSAPAFANDGHALADQAYGSSYQDFAVVSQESRALFFRCYDNGLFAVLVEASYTAGNTYNPVIPSTVTGPTTGKVYKVTDITDLGGNKASITLSSNLTIIREGIFGGSSIKTVDVPASVKTIEKNAFWNCTSLATATFHEGLETVGANAFSGTKLTSVVLPTSVKSLGSGAFSCDNLTSITVGGPALTEFPSGVFKTSNLTTLTLNEGVKKIGTSAFSNSKLKTVVLPNSLTEIGNSAFASCSQLASVTLGSGLLKIGEDAFRNCPNLVTGDLPNSITYIGDHAFSLCNKLTDKLSFGNNITYIGTGAFGNLPIASLHLPSGVTVGSAAFAGCDQIQTLNVAVPSITTTDFSTKKVVTLILRNGVQSIGDGAFSESTNLFTADLPNSLRTIGNYAFANTIFEKVNLSGVTSIGQGAFMNNKALKEAIMSNDLTTLGAEAFYGCTSLETVALGKKITAIGDNTFNNCGKITTITIPASVKTIGQSAFIGTSLTSIVLGEGLQSIGQKAFAYSNALTNIVSYATTAPTLGASVFEGVPANASVKVPCSGLSSYQSKWSYFSNISTMSPVYAESEDEAKGTVTITHAGDCNNPVVVLVATAKTGYKFQRWSDGNTDNPRTITSSDEMHLTAYFETAEGIEEVIANGIKDNRKVIIDGQLFIFGTNGEVYNAQGIRVH